MMRIPGCVRRALKFQRTRQRRRPPWPNSLGKWHPRIQDSLPTHQRETDNFRSLLVNIAVPHYNICISHTSLLLGPLTPGLPHTSQNIDYASRILHSVLLSHSYSLAPVLSVLLVHFVPHVSYKGLLTMTAFLFSSRKFVPTKLEQSVRREIDEDSRERCRKSVVLSSPSLS